MIGRRVGSKLAARIDPEGVVHEAFVRAKPRWLALEPKPVHPDAWIYGQVLDRLIEVIRSSPWGRSTTSTARSPGRTPPPGP